LQAAFIKRGANAVQNEWLSAPRKLFPRAG